MKKFRILFIINSLQNGGAENVLINLVNNMNEELFDITVQTVFDTGSKKELLKKHIRYIYSFKKSVKGNSKLFSLLPSRLLYKKLVKEEYDIVVSYLQGVTAHILSGCPYSNTKKISWIHTAFSNDNEFKAGFVSRNAAIKAYNSFDRIAFVSESVLKRFEEVSAIKLKNGIVLYNTIESDDIYQKSLEKVNDIRFKENEINLISVGKIIDYKGYDRLARVHKRLIDEGLKHHIYVLGKGPQQSEIEDYLRNNQLEKSFTFLGFKDNPYKYVTKADLFVCSSYREGFSTAVTESLIVGTPVLSTNCSGAYELLGKNNEYGIVTDNSEDGLYKGIKMFLENRELLDYFKYKAKERGRLFEKEKTVKAAEDLFLSLCED